MLQKAYYFYLQTKTSVEEIEALLGLRYLSEAMKNNNLSTNDLFDKTLCS